MVVRMSICTAVLLLFVVSTIAQEVRRGIPFFLRGRLHKGNLCEPAKTRPIPINTILEEYIDQHLDHFTPSDTRTWKQRFFTNAEFFKKGGPAFVFIGGESTASESWMHLGEWIENAEKFHALCFQLEHRFYGESQPMPDLSTENLAYLNSEQATADLAFFIQAMNIRYNLADTKWVLWGGSYSGSLAAWTRFEYPHLVYAALCSSGPVLLKLDFQDYFVVVGDVLKDHSKTCEEAVSDGTQEIGRLLQQSSGQNQLIEIFRSCDAVDANNPMEVGNFYQTFANNFAGAVQYNNDNVGIPSVADVCNIMVNESIGSPVQRLGAVNALFFDLAGTDCVDYSYRSFIDLFRNVSLSAPASMSGSRQWVWQTCTEFGFAQASTKVSKLFGDDFPVDFFVKQCADLFGPNLTKKFQQNAVDRSNTIHGGLRLQASRVVYVEGSADPWRSLCMTRTLHPDAPAIYIEGTAHVADMYPSLPSDPKQLTKAREMVHNYLEQWLRESDCYSDSPIVMVASPWWGFGWAQPFVNRVWNPMSFVQALGVW